NPNDFFTFEGTKLHFKSGLRGLNGVVTIDPSKSPKWMDHTFQNGKQVHKGIYEFKGDKLRVLMGLPGGERPTEFKTKEGDKLWLRTFERAPLWKPRPLASAEVPLPDRIAQADLVVVGRVTAVENESFEAKPFPGSADKPTYRVLGMKADEILLGDKMTKKI